MLTRIYANNVDASGHALRESLQDVWPDFRSFRLVDVGLNTKALSLRFDMPGRKGDDSLLFHQLSDGERALIGLYMIRAALDTGAVETVLIDEPDNYVGLPELQPWVLAVRELLDDEHQVKRLKPGWVRPWQGSNIIRTVDGGGRNDLIEKPKGSRRR